MIANRSLQTSLTRKTSKSIPTMQNNTLSTETDATTGKMYIPG